MDFSQEAPTSNLTLILKKGTESLKWILKPQSEDMFRERERAARMVTRTDSKQARNRLDRMQAMQMRATKTNKHTNLPHCTHSSNCWRIKELIQVMRAMQQIKELIQVMRAMQQIKELVQVMLAMQQIKELIQVMGAMQQIKELIQVLLNSIPR